MQRNSGCVHIKHNKNIQKQCKGTKCEKEVILRI